MTYLPSHSCDKEGKKCKAKTVALWLSVVRCNPTVSEYDLTNFQTHPGLSQHMLHRLQSFVAQYKPLRESANDRDKLTDMHREMYMHFLHIARLARKREEARKNSAG